MSVPSAISAIGKAGSSASGTTLVITLTAAAAVGDIVYVFVAFTSGGAISTIVDSKSNVWVKGVGQGFGSGSPSGVYCIAYVTTALAIADTITITFGGTQQAAAAAAVQISGASTTNSAQPIDGSSPATAASTSAKPNALATTHPDDVVFFAVVGTYNGSGQVLLTDFTSGSIDSSYSVLASVVSAGGTSGCGVSVAYKTVVATPGSQQPTYTLNTSRTWSAALAMASGLTDRGAKGTFTRAGDLAANTVKASPQGELGSLNLGQKAKGVTDGFPQPVPPTVVKRDVQLVPDYSISSE